jgi:2-(1,2-epoxy-1,2-dihydrophenyl)acetyl-CoA isomerase
MSTTDKTTSNHAPGTEVLLKRRTADGVLILTLNDPATRNALGPELSEDLVRTVKDFGSDPDLRCLVLTGAGQAFCSGANVRGFKKRIEEAEKARSEPSARSDPGPGPWEALDPVYGARERGGQRQGPEIVRVLHNLEKPSIAAVNGAAYGLGCGIALACDVRIAGRGARFSEAFIRNGLVPADGSTWQLPKLIGMANTLWMQYTGDPIDAEQALRMGLVNEVADDDKLLDRAVERATRLAKGPIYAMGLIKQLVHQAFQQDLTEHLALASRAQELARKTQDHKEGVAAFLEKRPPRFVGR